MLYRGCSISMHHVGHLLFLLIESGYSTPQKIMHMHMYNIVTTPKTYHNFFLPQKVVTFTTIMRNKLFFTVFYIHPPLRNIHDNRYNIFMVHTVCIIDFSLLILFFLLLKSWMLSNLKMSCFCLSSPNLATKVSPKHLFFQWQPCATVLNQPSSYQINIIQSQDSKLLCCYMRERERERQRSYCAHLVSGCSHETVELYGYFFVTS